MIGTGFKFVHLLHDAEESKVGVKLVRENDGGAFGLNMPKSGTYVSCSCFIKGFKLLPGRYSVEYDETQRLLVATVKHAK
jgi:hypothetical protein